MKAYANIAQPDRCIVNLYELYMSKRPIHMNIDDFYLRPLANVKANTWYASQPIGRNTLSKVVASLAKEAGFKGNYSNHSLCATAASRLYNANVDEQLISEVTGHRSSAVRGYKCTSNDQLKAISNILYGGVSDQKCSDLKAICDEKSELITKPEHECECKKCKVDVALDGNSEKLPFNINVTVNINK